MTRIRFALAFVVGLLGLSVADAQVKYPPRPEKYDLQLRYRIRADRDERVRQFRVLEDYLERLGFKESRKTADPPDPDYSLDILDPNAERFSGTMPATGLFPKVTDPPGWDVLPMRDPRVKTILFAPVGYKYPEIENPVPLRIGIDPNFLPPDRQRLHRQVVAQLNKMGFREAVGYDHIGYTAIRGSLPYGNLFRLLKDLRGEPGGWLLADAPATQLPYPLRGTLPIRWIEVLSEADPNAFNPPAVGGNRERFTPDIRVVLDNETVRNQPLRVEVVYDAVPDDRQLDALRARLRAEYSTVVTNPATKVPELDFATVEGVVTAS